MIADGLEDGSQGVEERIYLSPPDVGLEERKLLLEAFDSNWIAPVGPHIAQFEREFAKAVGVEHAVALSSGTAALHIALRLLGIGPEDSVLVPTLTFVASANAVSYTGATPVFVDSEPTTWNIDPNLVEDTLKSRARNGTLPRAIVSVDLYGQCADYQSLGALSKEYGIPIVEDAAEALGAEAMGRAAGTFGDVAGFSFNGNKIITTGGGGMLVTNRTEVAERARHLATQARDPAPHYEHSETGYNYRMSNLLAALGRGQLRSLASKVAKRRAIYDSYRESLADLPGLTFMPEPEGFRSTRWLTVALVDPAVAGTDRGTLMQALQTAGIEARPAWKPMHLQSLFQGCQVIGGSVAKDIFQRGLCLPSGSSLTPAEFERVISVLRRAWGAGL